MAKSFKLTEFINCVPDRSVDLCDEEVRRLLVIAEHRLSQLRQIEGRSFPKLDAGLLVRIRQIMADFQIY